MKIKTEISSQQAGLSASGASVDQENKESLDKWCLILGVTRDELLEAIKEHGNQIKDIRKGFRQKRNNKAA